MTEELLSLPVPPVPAGETGVAWLRGDVVRFSEGADHERRRALTTALLDNVQATTLDELAGALRLSGSLADIAAIAPAYQPHTPITAEADAAVERLAGDRSEETAARIGLLVQAWAATHALAEHLRTGNPNPPVPITRRYTEQGVVEVDLTEHPFGHGKHACPGRELALTIAKNTAFHALHHGEEPLVLPNAWDYASATALAQEFPAVGTTSLGVSAAHGVPDASGMAKQHTKALAHLLKDLPCPVTADIEAGFSEDPGEVAEFVAELGVAGINIEDSRGDRLADPRHQAKLIAAIKQRSPGIFVNARIDTHWFGIDATTKAVLDRAEHYLNAGADGIFVPGLDEIAEVARKTEVPLNVLATPGTTTKQLADLGVRRISTGSLLFRAALDATVATARAVRDGVAPRARSYAEVHALISPGTRSAAG